MENYDNKYDVLKHYFGYKEFREGQEDLIDEILSGRDVLGIMPTGAGKSLCYQVPALMMKGITIVISPLISLMKDQVRALNEAGVHAAYINSSLTEGQIAKALQFAARGRYKIIYVAPERLTTYGFLQAMKQVEISQVTVDEAHCISAWGQDFRPSYLKILDFIAMLDTRPVVSAFTATATEEVREDILKILRLHDPKMLITGFDRPALYYGVVTPLKKDNYVLGYVNQHKGKSGIIYCATRKNVDKVYDLLVANGISATRYHAGMDDEERRMAQDDFIYDRADIVVATNAFGMGIDKSNVRFVLHYNMPQSLENYYQEAGRAGRDGEEAECILLYSGQDVVINRFLLDSKEDNPDLTVDETLEIKRRDEKRLQAMINYCLTKECLREYILSYFGEHKKCECDNCSNCQMEYEEEDVSDIAKAVINLVMELRGRFGTGLVCQVLIGSGNAKVRQYGLTESPSYGKLSGYGEGEIKEVISELIFQNILKKTDDRYGLLRVADGAVDVVTGERSVILKKPVNNDALDYENVSAGMKKHVRSASSRSKSKASTYVLNGKGDELFEQLRQLRLDIARQESVPPYIVFSDKALTDMCVKTPATLDEMLDVSGVGENKLDRYGKQFLDKILEFTGGSKPKLYLD